MFSVSFSHCSCIHFRVLDFSLFSHGQELFHEYETQHYFWLYHLLLCKPVMFFYFISFNGTTFMFLLQSLSDFSVVFCLITSARYFAPSGLMPLSVIPYNHWYALDQHFVLLKNLTTKIKFSQRIVVFKNFTECFETIVSNHIFYDKSTYHSCSNDYSVTSMCF